MKKSARKSALSVGSVKPLSNNADVENNPGWQALLDQDQDDMYLLEITDNIIKKSYEDITNKTVEISKITYFIDAFCEAWVKLVKWRWLNLDMHEDDDDWVPDFEPPTSPKDPWLTRTDFMPPHEFKRLEIVDTGLFNYDDPDTASSSDMSCSEYDLHGMKKVSGPKKKKKRPSKTKKKKAKEKQELKLEYSKSPEESIKADTNVNTLKKTAALFEKSESSLNIVIPRCDYNLACNLVSRKSIENRRKSSVTEQSLILDQPDYDEHDLQEDLPIPATARESIKSRNMDSENVKNVKFANKKKH